MTEKTQSILAVLCIIIALVLLYPGVTQPVLSLSGTVAKSDIAQLGIDMLAGDDSSDQMHQMLSGMSAFFGFDRIDGELEVYQSTRSIWTTVESLARSGNLVVAFLIVFFSVWIPVFKLLLQLTALLFRKSAWCKALWSVNSALSKWSMADVFVMALLVAYLAGSASENMGELLTMRAQLEVGFYYFLAYCIFSIAAGSLMVMLNRRRRTAS